MAEDQEPEPTAENIPVEETEAEAEPAVDEASSEEAPVAEDESLDDEEIDLEIDLEAMLDLDDDGATSESDTPPEAAVDEEALAALDAEVDAVLAETKTDQPDQGDTSFDLDSEFDLSSDISEDDIKDKSA